jgi:hypothetical protein
MGSRSYSRTTGMDLESSGSLTERASDAFSCLCRSVLVPALVPNVVKSPGSKGFGKTWPESPFWNSCFSGGKFITRGHIRLCPASHGAEFRAIRKLLIPNGRFWQESLSQKLWVVKQRCATAKQPMRDHHLRLVSPSIRRNRDTHAADRMLCSQIVSTRHPSERRSLRTR